SQTSAEIAFGDFERFVRCLDAFGVRLDHTFALLEIQKSASHFGGDRAPCCFERCHGRFPPRPGGLHSSFSGEAVEKMPAAAHANQISVIEFRPDRRVALVVNFVARKSLNVWTQLALVDLQLSIFNLDIDLPFSYFGALGVGPAETFV